MNTGTKRLDYIDALKGFGILLVVLGHMHFGYDNCTKYIFAFHMPLFFLVSGYLYKTPTRLFTGIKQKMKSLLIPYFVFGLGYYFLWLIRNFSSGANWKSPLKAVLWVSVDGLKIESALWFLMVLFWAWILYAVIDKFVKDQWLKIFLVIVLSTVGCLWGYIMPFRLPWGLQDALAVQIFFLLGQTYRHFEGKGNRIILSWNELSAKKKIGFLIVGLLINAAFIYKTGMLNVRLGQWPAFAGTYLNAVLAVWLWAELIKCILKNKKIDTVVGYVLKRMGMFSIVWLCFNHPVISISKRITDLFCSHIQYSILTQAIIVILSIGILYAIAEIVMHTPLRIFFGKWDNKRWAKKREVRS